MGSNFWFHGQLIALGYQKRWIGIGLRTELLVKPQKMLLGTYYGPTFFAQLKFKFVSFRQTVFIKSGQVPCG